MSCTRRHLRRPERLVYDPVEYGAFRFRASSQKLLGLGNRLARCRNELLAVHNGIPEAPYILPNATCLRVTYVRTQISYLGTRSKVNAEGSLRLLQIRFFWSRCHSKGQAAG